MSESQLAIDGGPPTIPEGPPGWPDSDPDVLAALVQAHRDGSWGQYRGRYCAELSEMLATMHQCEHVQLCSSGTVAVELALRGLNIQPGDEVALGGYDFSGNFRCIEAVGARPVLVDIDPNSACIDADQLKEANSENLRAVIVSHLHGGIADMESIARWSARHNVAVVEDACQAPGALVAGRRAATWGDVSVLSFGGSKLLSAGRGGAVLTKHPEIRQRIKVFAERGNDAFPLSELQAAVLIPQLKKLDANNLTRAAAASRLLRSIPLDSVLLPVSNTSAHNRPSYYKMAWMFSGRSGDGRSRERFISAIQAEGVAMAAGFRGFTRRGPRRCRVASNLSCSAKAADSLVLLHHPLLLQPVETIDRVSRAITKVMKKFEM